MNERIPPPARAGYPLSVRVVAARVGARATAPLGVLGRSFSLLVGPPETFPLRHRLLNAVLVAAMLTCFPSCVLNATVLAKPGVPLPLFLSGLVHAVSYAMSRSRRWLAAIVPITILNPLVLSLWCWFPSGGRRGPAPMFLFIAGLIPITVAKGSQRVIGFGLYLVASIAVLGLESLHPEWVAAVYRTRELEYVDATLSYGLSLFAVGSFMFVLSKSYDTVLGSLAAEQDQSQRLLDNVLPPSVSARLKSDAGSLADGFESVTVLFADIVGFTELTSSMPPRNVVEMLNDVFSKFDALSLHHRLEKVKTIGDSYMAVAGIPFPLPDHARAATEMALDMLAELPRGLRLRIGLHSGPAVAGVIGTTKFIYDLWGDTVNTASRMESHGEPGRIQISKATTALLGSDPGLRIVPRGTITVKGKGEMETFFVERAPHD